MRSNASWNRRRTLVFLRYSRLYRVPLSIGALAALSARYERKHLHERAPIQVALPDEPTTPAHHPSRSGILTQLAGLLLADRAHAVTSASSRRAVVPLSRGWLPWPP